MHLNLKNVKEHPEHKRLLSQLVEVEDNTPISMVQAAYKNKKKASYAAAAAKTTIKKKHHSSLKSHKDREKRSGLA